MRKPWDSGGRLTRRQSRWPALALGAATTLVGCSAGGSPGTVSAAHEVTASEQAVCPNPTGVLSGTFGSSPPSSLADSGQFSLIQFRGVTLRVANDVLTVTFITEGSPQVPSVRVANGSELGTGTLLAYSLNLTATNYGNLISYSMNNNGQYSLGAGQGSISDAYATASGPDLTLTIPVTDLTLDTALPKRFLWTASGLFAPLGDNGADSPVFTDGCPSTSAHTVRTSTGASSPWSAFPNSEVLSADGSSSPTTAAVTSSTATTVALGSSTPRFTECASPDPTCYILVGFNASFSGGVDGIASALNQAIQPDNPSVIVTCAPPSGEFAPGVSVDCQAGPEDNGSGATLANDITVRVGDGTFTVTSVVEYRR